jgi:hypothetical protein
VVGVLGLGIIVGKVLKSFKTAKKTICSVKMANYLSININKITCVATWPLFPQNKKIHYFFYKFGGYI